ncbi:MAG: COX15/CtaA family protein [Chloroflexi bacterium]|nr:COX15/CtaA family protein [Chloroflexota bacterium]
MRMLQYLASASVIGTVAAAIMGSYVRGMGAGLACPDWPLCHGALIPPLELPILLEWGHRLIVLGVTLCVAAVGLLTWRKRLPARFNALQSLVLLVTQAVLGGITVIVRLNPAIVALHQGLALIFFRLARRAGAGIAAHDAPFSRSAGPGCGQVKQFVV